MHLVVNAGCILARCLNLPDHFSDGWSYSFTVLNNQGVAAPTITTDQHPRGLIHGSSLAQKMGFSYDSSSYATQTGSLLNCNSLEMREKVKLL